MSQEDAIAQKMLDYFQRLSLESAELEVHYNDFGSRGIVDLVIELKSEPMDEDVEQLAEEDPYMERWDARERLTKNILWVCEIKSESAIRNVTGANAVIRQFNSHREYFFDGSDYNSLAYDTVNWVLALQLSRYNFDHLSENLSLYHSVFLKQPNVQLQWWHPQHGRRNGPFRNEAGDLMDYHDVNPEGRKSRET